jgi:uncharacterized membrane protein (UPF0127 family)
MTRCRVLALLVPVAGMLLGPGSVQARADSADDFPRIRVVWPSGSGPARLAYTNRQRSIGYRHLAREQAPPAIYFRYPEPRKVHFHMRDVRFPVRAWWLDTDGCALSFTDMEPGTDGHTPPEAVTAVLEVPLFRLGAYPLRVGDCIDWSRQTRQKKPAEGGRNEGGNQPEQGTLQAR